ncbi:MAG: MFS transporter [Proteobacteria bacterium]|nr:MFS transporter [Pseudomonadota bacterium]
MLVASLLFMIIGTGSVFFLVVALKLISAEFDWPRSVPSIAYSMQYLGAGVGGIFMGYCLDKLGMTIPALLGASMIGAGAVLTSFVSAPWHLYVIYGVMMGFLGRSTLFSPLTANITRWFEHNKSKAVGIVGSGQALAGALWPPVFQHFFEAVGWRQTSFWYGLFALATMLPLVLILRQKPPGEAAPAARAVPVKPSTKPAQSQEQRDAPGARAGLSPLKMQTILSIASIGCCVAMSLPLAHLVSHVSDIGYEPARGAEILSIMLASAAASSFFGVGYLGGRFGGLRALFVFSTAQAAFLAAWAFVDGLAGIYIIAALFGLGYGGILPSYPVIVREYLPASQVGRRTAIVILCAGSGMALGAWRGFRLDRVL